MEPPHSPPSAPRDAQPLAPPETAESREARRPPSRRAQQPKAFGRALADFGELSPAEQKLMEGCRYGRDVTIAKDRPQRPAPDITLRSSFVRFLALGGDEHAPVHERGVRLSGGWLTDPLDLREVALPVPLGLINCSIRSVLALNCKIPSLHLSGSRVDGGMIADGLECDKNLFMRSGFTCKGEISLIGATIGATLDCSGAWFNNPKGDALSLDRAAVSGSIFLNEASRTDGRIRLNAATVGGSVSCTGAKLNGVGGDALSLEGAQVGGDLLLRRCTVVGRITMIGATISGDIDCDGASLVTEGGTALVCNRLTLRGGFFFRRLEKVAGQVNLGSAKVAFLCDDLDSWSMSSGALVLDGFAYDGFGESSDIERRVEWLDLQVASHLGDEFRPQPWEHLIGVLRRMGHADDARTVAIIKHKRMRAAGRYVGGSKTWDTVYGALVGYGYRPWRLLWIAAAVWIFCAAVYSVGIRPNLVGAPAPLLAPARSETNVPCLVERVKTGVPRPCPKTPADFGNFVSLAYSAEVLLPVISLGSKAEWKPALTAPDGRSLHWGWVVFAVYWLEIVFGWLAGLLLVSAMGNLVKRD